MAIVIDTGNISSSTAGSVSSLTFANTVSSGATLLLVGVGFQSDAAPFESISVTYNGVAMTAIGSQMNNNDQQSQPFYMVNPPAGTHNVVITFSGTITSGCGGMAVSMSGSDTSTIFGTQVTTSSDLGPTSPFNHNITTTGTNSYVIDLFSSDRNLTDLTVGGSQTQIAATIYTNGRTAMSYRAAATATTYTETWTSSGPACQARSWILEVLVGPTTAIKNFNGLAYASTKNVNNLAVASMKNFNGLA